MKSSGIDKEYSLDDATGDEKLFTTMMMMNWLLFGGDFGSREKNYRFPMKAVNLRISTCESIKI